MAARPSADEVYLRYMQAQADGADSATLSRLLQEWNEAAGEGSEAEAAVSPRLSPVDQAYRQYMQAQARGADKATLARLLAAWSDAAADEREPEWADQSDDPSP